MLWKLEELTAAADAVDVANRIGIPITRCGATLYIPNVDGTKETRHEHTQLFHDGCYNYSTGVGRNTYGMIRDYYRNVLGRSISHDEICEIIADTCGGSDLYIVRKDKRQKRGRPFPLTNDELEAIGLVPRPRRNEVITAYSTFPADGLAHYTEKNGDGAFAKLAYSAGDSLYGLYQDDPEKFLRMAEGKAKEAIDACMDDYSWAKSKSPGDNGMASRVMESFIDILRGHYRLIKKAERKLALAHSSLSHQKAA